MTETVLNIDDIVWACTNLCELLEFENEALIRHDSRTVRELTDNKTALARIYENAIAPLADDPHLAETLEPEQKEELTALGLRLKALVEENALRLRAEIDATQMLMDAMVNAVKANTTNSVHYGPAGQYGNQGTGEQNSLAFNQTL
ncbi:conserved protein of unknown function [Magnetospirillum gryphiswaldense MSR-1 v2]|uniref:Flagellar protein FlgN n=1 Tax=Magnetospirillum gryphiswaldense (strain DSM 6361 / JCM 21280 / NBRC 15271 / MSR-1) TaxID=431944 RepID=V6F4C7_MAGGM|nr:flagellar protein FlgN [Magnetospirillum gryphiswaldense]CDK99328.1 conserved protein of unknown function [Magnetospirillum gryphiswaldense MSR-1 v2]